MEITLQIVHALLAIGLILAVLLQSGKDAGLPGAIAGGAQSLFGKKKGLEEKLSKLTSALAILFMVSSVVLAFLVGR
ncbi:MAG: preprotein translocase subunit SecG [Eubacteriales bacterium]|nr:preprotein translocase subunit SecG [Eubacteriales bacterium]MDD3073988.1 preprotein translocase subunit SecG [Eubacteriales bacterium]MDD4078715.1 preprotein translocase subunit SecG [Eubacteriales bacterium]MDD4769304.1 preprotein translocase subunit SecG [Eubacteriales bacterium]